MAALAALQTRSKNRSIRKRVDAALAAMAARGGLAPSQLLERTVPTFGLDQPGRSSTVLGEHVAELALQGEGLTLSLATSGARRLASVPAAVKAGHAAELARLKAVVKDAKKALPIERARLEGLLAVEGTWDRAEWERLYLRHPVTGHVARRLLWDFGDGRRWETARPGTDADAVGAGEALPTGPVVRLWHPIRATTDEVAGWRSALVRDEVRQPFKQAYREVYRLTPAEEETAEYSSRFAAHVLRYPQAAALMRAVFYYDLVEQDADRCGTPALCTTDQVRFETLAGNGPERVPLADVPPLVFTEAMRAVDPFVAVTSIAADPEWIDRGTERRFDVYWREFGLGELSESAVTRRAALERLFPRTRIADRCEVTDRWLVVRGNVGSYRIHIGSGNVVMEPDGTYLCIVPSRRTDLTEKLFLPFEEDGGRLSVVVSKAFLLAADERITDPTILGQMRRT